MEYLAVLGGLLIFLAGGCWAVPPAKRRAFIWGAAVSFLTVLYFQILAQPYRLSRILQDLSWL